MSNKATYYLREFKNGDYMLWSVCAQTSNTFKVIIKDDSTVYATFNKNTSAHNLQKLGQDAAYYKGGRNMRVEVEFDNKAIEIKESPVTGGITDRQTNTVGYSYTYCIEDATDNDYNDAYITIIAWRNQG